MTSAKEEVAIRYDLVLRLIARRTHESLMCVPNAPMPARPNSNELRPS
jgi:hypothetical protein